MQSTVLCALCCPLQVSSGGAWGCEAGLLSHGPRAHAPWGSGEDGITSSLLACHNQSAPLSSPATDFTATPPPPPSKPPTRPGQHPHLPLPCRPESSARDSCSLGSTQLPPRGRPARDFCCNGLPPVFTASQKLGKNLVSIFL